MCVLRNGALLWGDTAVGAFVVHLFVSGLKAGMPSSSSGQPPAFHAWV